MSRSVTLHSRRGVSEVIGTLMVLIVTVAGAVFIANFMQGEIFAVDQSADATKLRAGSVHIIGFDARDSASISDIAGLDNVFDLSLCTAACSASDNQLPTAGGTEFIVINVKNANTNSVFLHNLMLNNVGHTWDENAAGQQLLGPGTFPDDGKFSIIPISNDPPIVQQATNEVPGDGEVRLVIKLNDTIPVGIGMSDTLRILLNYGGSQPAEFIILSGDAKW